MRTLKVAIVAQLCARFFVPFFSHIETCVSCPFFRFSDRLLELFVVVDFGGVLALRPCDRLRIGENRSGPILLESCRLQWVPDRRRPLPRLVVQAGDTSVGGGRSGTSSSRGFAAKAFVRGASPGTFAPRASTQPRITGSACSPLRVSPQAPGRVASTRPLAAPAGVGETGYVSEESCSSPHSSSWMVARGRRVARHG